jgi:hypothetical protein
LRKAEITSDQLQRRYSVLYGSMLGSKILNLSDVARWYSGQDVQLRMSLENAEPFAWLRHLDKRRTKPSNHIHWHLSARIVEDYAHCHNLPNLTSKVASADRLSVSPPSQFIANPSPQYMSPRSPLEPTTSKAHSLEGQVSFEPLVDSARSSLDLIHRRSVEDPSGIHRRSLPSRIVSRRDSIHSRYSESSQQSPSRVPSPASSLLRVRDFSQRIRRRNPHTSDDGLSSARNSISERSEDDEKRTQDAKDQPRLVDSDLGSGREASVVDSGIEVVMSGDPSETEEGQVPGDESSKVQSRIVLKGKHVSHPSLNKPPSHPGPSHTTHRVLGRRRVKTSLPSPDKLSFRKERLLQLQANEEQTSREYELKAQ